MIETELVIARMQNRRGRRADLPQPLMPGELGFCTDTGQLFIGADENTNMTPGIEAFTQNVAATILANEICSILIMQVSIPAGLEAPAENLLTFVPNYIEVTENYAFYGWNTASGVPDVDDINLLFQDAAFYPITEPPYSGAKYVARMFTDLTLFPSNEFIKGEVIMPTYQKEDAGAVASIVNSIQFWSVTDGASPPQDPYTYTGTTGLVTTKENIEIYTEYSPGRGLPIKRILPPTATWEQVPGIDFTYSDALTVDYSLQSDEYSRVGNLKIICSPDNGVDAVTGMLFDTYTELFNMPVDPAIPVTFDFKLETLASPYDNVTALYYKTSGITSDITLTTSTKIWQSF